MHSFLRQSFGPCGLKILGLIGNCQFSALVARQRRVVWCCLPRFDSEPAFSMLLDSEVSVRFLVAVSQKRTDCVAVRIFSVSC